MGSQINAQQIRLISEEGDMLGVVPLKEGIARAADAGLELVEISPNANPPVCKIADMGKLKYEAKKKAHVAKRNQKQVEIKELKLRPNIGEHDLKIKEKSAAKFIEEGHKVKISLRFRGREITHQEIGLEVLNQFKEALSEIAKAEMGPKMEGKQMMMILVPAK